MKKTFFFICLIIIFLCFPNLVFNAISDPPVESVEPYIYYTTPQGAFGNGNLKVVNWSFFRDMFLNHFYKDCNYKRYSYSNWVNGNSYVTIDKTWNDSGFWKIDINLDVPVDLYEVNISFGCDLPVLNYVERQGFELWLNYSIDDSDEIYSVFFNWSDIANIQGLTINKHYDDVSKVWWISLHRNNVNSGFYSFDPWFGYQGLGSTLYNVENTVGLQKALMNNTNALADNISVHLDNAFGVASANVTCGIYYNDTNKTLLAQTEVRWINVTTTNAWWVFDFNGTVVLKPNYEYRLVVWAEEVSGPTGVAIRRYTSGGLGFWYDSETFDGTLPDPWSGFQSDADGRLMIYCSYTEGGIEFDPWSTDITLNGLSNSTNITFDGNKETENKKLWCNETGFAYETIEINITVNSTHLCDNITFWFGQLNNTNDTYTLNADSLYLEVSNDNISFYPIELDIGYGRSRFAPTGHNLWWNYTTANTSANPFDYYGNGVEIDTNCSLYARFKWNVTDNAYYGKYYNLSAGQISGSNNSGAETLGTEYVGSELVIFQYISPDVIVVSSEFPSNNSNNAPIQPYLYVTVNHSAGETMNISWYYGASEGSENTLLGTDVNISNSTQNQLFLEASTYNTEYFWRVMVNDGERTWINETFIFNTTGTSGSGRITSLWIIGVLFGIFGIMSLFIGTRRKEMKKIKKPKNHSGDEYYGSGY